MGFRSGGFGGHSLKHSELTSGIQVGAHAAQLKRFGKHKSFAVVGEYLERGNLFADHPLANAL